MTAHADSSRYDTYEPLRRRASVERSDGVLQTRSIDISASRQTRSTARVPFFFLLSVPFVLRKSTHGPVLEQRLVLPLLNDLFLCLSAYTIALFYFDIMGKHSMYISHLTTKLHLIYVIVFNA
jgi:hypothetical protein